MQVPGHPVAMQPQHGRSQQKRGPTMGREGVLVNNVSLEHACISQPQLSLSALGYVLQLI